jgi:tetratricopeptide (TPR) repeat protein
VLGGLLLCLLAASSAAADISVRAQLDRSRVQVGDSADLSVSVEGAQNAPAPAVGNADGLSIRYVGPSTQVSIVNGRVSASVTHHFSVTALKTGTFTIGPITVDYDGKRYNAGRVTLQALAAPPPQTGGQATAPAGQGLKLVLSAARSEVYLHERVPVSLKLYVGNVRVSDVQYPLIPGDGFALEKLQHPSQRQEQTREGTFQVLDFETGLTPLRGGTLTIGPAKLSLSVLERRRRTGDPFFDQFFGNDPFGNFFGTSSRAVELHSDPLALTVLPLPEAGRPADFSGAVGHFDFLVKAAPLDLQAGDPVTVTMTIRGAGNLDNVKTPSFAASDALRVYATQAQPSHNPQEKVFEQVVIPQHSGAVTLPELQFSYFDPAARAYRTIAHPAIALNVHPAAHAQSAPQIVGAAPAAAPRVEEPLGRDIVFIKDTPGNLIPRGARRYRSALFWAYQPLPLLVWVAAVFYDRHRRRLSGDVRYARFTRAGQKARRAMTGAREALQAGDRVAFYDAIARAVSDYLGAKLDLPPGSVTADTVGERLRAQGAFPQAAKIADDVHEFFVTCEQVRFAPGAATDGDMKRTLERADAIVHALERERRLIPRAAALVLLAIATGSSGIGWAVPKPARPNTLFFHANALYSEEHYPEAAAEYEKILAGGRESGNVYFNLGNAYFKAGDTGRAILNYERARRLMPRDPDLLANLSYAQNVSGDTDATPIYAELLFPLADRMSSDELLLTASLLYTLLMILLAVGRLLPRARRVAVRTTIVAGVVLVVLMGSGAYRLATVDLPTYAVVVAKNETTVRFEPSDNGTAHYAAKPGTVLRILTEREGWAQVARRDGQRGWVEAKALARL